MAAQHYAVSWRWLGVAIARQEESVSRDRDWQNLHAASVDEDTKTAACHLTAVDRGVGI